MYDKFEGGKNRAYLYVHHFEYSNRKPGFICIHFQMRTFKACVNALGPAVHSKTTSLRIDKVLARYVFGHPQTKV